MGESFVTNVNCGGIVAGTELHASDTLQDTVKNMLWEYRPPEPSTEYESKSLGTWSSITDVDNFFSVHNVENGFSGIKIGNYVAINDGTYNKIWVVAGFNLEHNGIASDYTTYNNGYGILMIPKTYLTTAKWDSSYYGTPYIQSEMHTNTLSSISNNLKNVLGSHMVNRNVLLGSELNGISPRNKTTSAYQWTTSYLTLMSIGQMTGTFTSNNNKYDDGEANYKLPLFDHEDYYVGSYIWSRGVWAAKVVLIFPFGVQ